jgi:hypothetical protein
MAETLRGPKAFRGKYTPEEYERILRAVEAQEREALMQGTLSQQQVQPVQMARDLPSMGVGPGPMPPPQRPGMPPMQGPQPDPNMQPQQPVDPQAGAQPGAQPGFGDMDALPPGVMVGPPKDEAETETRVSGWRAFIEKLKTDPTTQMMAMRIGTSLMQPVPVGQSTAGHVGLAIQDSMNYGAALKNAEMNRAKVKADIDLTTSQSTQALSSAENLGASASKTLTETQGLMLEQDYYKQTLGQRIDLLNAEIEKAGAAAGLSTAQTNRYKEDARLAGPESLALNELRRAQAWHYLNPNASVRAQAKAKEDYTKFMASHLLVADPALRELHKKDPGAAYSQAVVRANELSIAGGVTQDLSRQTAEQVLEGLRYEYKLRKDAGDKYATEADFDLWVLGILSDPMRKYEPAVRDQIFATLAKQRGKPQQPQPGTRQRLDSKGNFVTP